jgi:hypothetical protein
MRVLRGLLKLMITLFCRGLWRRRLCIVPALSWLWIDDGEGLAYGAAGPRAAGHGDVGTAAGRTLPDLSHLVQWDDRVWRTKSRTVFNWYLRILVDRDFIGPFDGLT